MNGNKEFYMHKADSANLKRLYLTSIQFEGNGWDSFFVQAQLRKAAEGNYRLAQRWLGILGLCKLIHSFLLYPIVLYVWYLRDYNSILVFLLPLGNQSAK